MLKNKQVQCGQYVNIAVYCRYSPYVTHVSYVHTLTSSFSQSLYLDFFGQCLLLHCLKYQCALSSGLHINQCCVEITFAFSDRGTVFTVTFLSVCSLESYFWIFS